MGAGQRDEGNTGRLLASNRAPNGFQGKRAMHRSDVIRGGGGEGWQNTHQYVYATLMQAVEYLSEAFGQNEESEPIDTYKS